jgi:glycosyltransferase involved in cell wall biosynthesis
MTADAIGGVWPYAMTLAEALGPAAEIVLAVMGPPPAAAQQLAAAALPNLRLLHGDYRLEWMPDAAADIGRSREWLRHLAAIWRPDIIHLNGYAQAAGRWPAPVLVAAHSCVLSWWQAVHRCPPPREWRGYARRVRAGLAAAERIVAPSGAMLDALARPYGLPRGGDIVRNGCAPGRRAAAPKEDFVLAAGRLWDEGKNLAALDAAAALLSWPVYLAGDPRHPSGRRFASKAAQALGPLAPPVLAEWMARAAIYALPARYEPFGLSILEAAASGCALILGDIPSLRELWQDAAVFVPPDDPGAIAASIDRLIGDRERRSLLAAAALRRARRYSATRMARGYARIYRELAPAPRPAAAMAAEAAG